MDEFLVVFVGEKETLEKKIFRVKPSRKGIPLTSTLFNQESKPFSPGIGDSTGGVVR